jgi:penicillin-binding protein 1A
LARPIAGKTGSTNDFKDSWFVGFTPDLVVGVFVGFDNPRSLGPKETGSRVAIPIFKKFMGEAMMNKPVLRFKGL